jgi:hypothetical protein
MSSRPRKRRRETQPPLLAEPTGFSSLTRAEQVHYLQALWGSISERAGEIPVPESHLTLAEERLAEYRRDPSRACRAQGRRIHVPRADHLKPNRDFLAERYAIFRRAS